MPMFCSQVRRKQFSIQLPLPSSQVLIMIEVRDYPERDIWSLGVMVQGSGQMGELLGRRRRRRRRRRRPPATPTTAATPRDPPRPPGDPPATRDINI